jgi:ATP-dependent Lon protease
MEIIDLSSYLMEEKIEIAKRHLIPRQIAEHGLTKKHIQFSNTLIQQIIGDYTAKQALGYLKKTLPKLFATKPF